MTDIRPAIPTKIKSITSLMRFGGGCGILFGLVGLALVGGFAAAFFVLMIGLGIAEIVLATRIRSADRNARTIASVLCGASAVIALPTLPTGLFTVAVNAYIVYILQMDEESKQFFDGTS